MSKKNFDYKDVVGKLMSQENISIVHLRDAKTASFDISKRVLYLPEFVDVSEEVYDLLIGHEVSHALHTPERGWHKSTEKKGANFKTFLNVVEDARIEKKIQKKFPGLKSSFKKGYKELYDMDLFGIKNKSQKEIDDLLLIDRLNLYFKLGQLQSGVSFKKEEMHFVEDMANLKNWKDVVDLAERLFEYCKEEMKEKQQDRENNQDGDPSSETASGDITGEAGDSSEGEEEVEVDQSEGDENSSEESGEGDSANDSENEFGGKSENTDQKPDGDSDESKSPQTDAGTGGESDNYNFDHKYNDEEPVSFTDKNFREREQELAYDEEKQGARWYKECSSDLPVLDKEHFYDDWRKILIQVAEWRTSAMLKGW